MEYHIGAGSGAIDADGWIAVPQVAGFSPNVNGVLMSLNTAFLNGATVDLTGLVQGQSTTTKVPLQQNRFFKVRMKKRQAGNAATEVLAGVSNPTAMFNTIYKNVPQFGSWMPSTSAEFGVACLDVQELIGGGIDCTPITDGFHVNYTAANPNMGGVSLTLYGPGGPYSVDNVAPTSSVAETFGTASGLSNAGGIVDVKTLKKCAYSVWLSVELKLTDGRTQHSDIHDWLSFCKQ